MLDTKKPSIFLSWSGEESKQIAKKLKKTLLYFFDEKIDVFFSSEDISSGSEWFGSIKNELQSCKMGILCITKDNFDSAWINFEAGAMVACNIKVIPVLFGVDRRIYKSPLNSVNNVVFEKEDFCKLLQNISVNLGISLPQNVLNERAKQQYTKLKKELRVILNSLQDKRMFSVKYIFPSCVNKVNKNTLYVSTPMASIDKPEYTKQREFLIALEKVLIQIGFKNIISPALAIDKQENFDGSTKANFDNYKEMKQVESFLVIYPKPLPTSVLVEIGYAIALSKNIVLFTKNLKELPFMLQEANATIPNLRIYSYKNYDDIIKIVESNKMALFEVMEE